MPKSLARKNSASADERFSGQRPQEEKSEHIPHRSIRPRGAPDAVADDGRRGAGALDLALGRLAGGPRLDVAREMGLPVACTSTVAEELGFDEAAIYVDADPES